MSIQDLWDAIAEQPRITSRRELVMRVAEAERGAESYLEEQGARRILTGKGFRSIVRQHRVTVAGERFRVDSYDPATLTAIEFDGQQGHASPEDRRKDKVRDALLASVGILTLRFEYPDVIGRPEWCREVVLRTLRERSTTRDAERDVPPETASVENQS